MENWDLDEVGNWTQIKLEIVRKYSAAYTTVMRKQSAIDHYAYIDGFAGAGSHRARGKDEEIPGSPAIALDHNYTQYHFVDLDRSRAERLRKLASNRENVTVYEGDCNEVLLRDVLPQYRYETYRRALCLLDPYGLNPKWEVVEQAGQLGTIDMFLNFMIMDANRNVLWARPNEVTQEQIARMDAFWGDGTWREAAYRTMAGLFGEMQEKLTNEAVVSAYCQRLKDVAGFKYVPEPLPLRNSKNAVIYFLVFASNKPAGRNIARDIFAKWRELDHAQ